MLHQQQLLSVHLQLYPLLLMLQLELQVVWIALEDKRQGANKLFGAPVVGTMSTKFSHWQILILLQIKQAIHLMLQEQRMIILQQQKRQREILASVVTLWILVKLNLFYHLVTLPQEVLRLKRIINGHVHQNTQMILMVLIKKCQIMFSPWNHLEVGGAVMELS